MSLLSTTSQGYITLPKNYMVDTDITIPDLITIPGLKCSTDTHFKSTYVDKRCVINHVDLVAKNVVNVELKILPGSDEATCVVSLTSEANCELENFANASISITGREEQISTSLWFNESSLDVASIKVCVQTECHSSRSRYSYKEIYFLPTGVPPVIKVCEVQNHLTLIESKNFEGENVYPIGVTHTDVHMSCSFERDPGRTK
ncbi:hypothetical protein HELRODRAFT_169396 [Helobdella robusta]|uniref:Uncharacterized protein n=1 Tax=Helobdella robusta TaxID=6412 RepID=T1F1W2_HELRO|nr:hypothetical protein HELRODRAFT_169396 [Helobdella robusta]ESO08533.1 hypothetical protein HELRODRAFT_169396 [Helobdella robusta]